MRLAWAVAPVLLAAAPAQAEDCQAIDPADIKGWVERILGTDSRDGLNESFEEVALLHFHWANHCEESRREASVDVVNQLARLLVLHGARRIVSSILFDVGPNLSAARDPLKVALADQNEWIRVHWDDSAIFVGNRGQDISEYLGCVLEKVESGRVDEDLCFGLILEGKDYRKLLSDRKIRDELYQEYREYLDRISMSEIAE